LIPVVAKPLGYQPDGKPREQNESLFPISPQIGMNVGSDKRTVNLNEVGRGRDGREDGFLPESLRGQIGLKESIINEFVIEND